MRIEAKHGIRTDDREEKEGKEEGDHERDPDGEWLVGDSSANGEGEESNVDEHAEGEALLFEDRENHLDQ